MDHRTLVTDYLRSLQDAICAGLEHCDGSSHFHEDNWQHHAGGGGRSRVITHGAVFEKGGVNFSAVEGELPGFLKNHVSEGAARFFATGVSLVLHPLSPKVPIVHMNVRYFESDAGDAWFGGGIDLTPIYVVEEDVRHFHRTLKDVCDRFDPEAYARFKQTADNYFFIPHRGETRGVGGIFYDYLRVGKEGSFEGLFRLMQDVGNAFLPAYLPIANAHKAESWTEREQQWQRIRRGRYVEFNLVYDRGTRFGLETGGRIESILMSLPEHASWIYDHRPEPGSPEDLTRRQLIKGTDWV